MIREAGTRYAASSAAVASSLAPGATASDLTLSGALDVAGVAEFTNDVEFTGDVNIGGGPTAGHMLTVSGTSRFGSDVTLDGAATDLVAGGNVKAARFRASAGGAANNVAFGFETGGADDGVAGYYRSAANDTRLSANSLDVHSFTAAVGSIANGFFLASGSAQVNGNFVAAGLSSAPPRTVDIDAAADTISVSGSSVVRVTLSAGSIVITAAPFIANGSVDGQELEIIRHSDAGDLTLPDETTTAGSNLRLGAATRVLGPRDSLKLRWVAAVGDWLETAYVNAL